MAAIGLIVGLTFREHPYNLLVLVLLAIVVRQPKPALPAFVALAVGMAFSPFIPNKGIDRVQYIRSTAKIASVPRLFPDRVSYTAQVQGHLLAVSEPLSADRSLGDRLWVEGLVKPLREGNEYLLTKGIVGFLQPQSIEALNRGPAILRYAQNVRRQFMHTTRRLLGSGDAAILDALCFNVDGGISEEFEKDLRDTNTFHIISASGLHVFVLAWSLDFLLGLVPIPRPIRLLILGGLLGFYAAAAGLQAPILRAALMSFLAMTAYLWRREADVLSALALAAILYLIADPLGVYNMGFQFSFMTVAAFALFDLQRDTYPTTAIGAVKDLLAQAFHTTHVAYWATLPLLVYYFGTISIVAIPSNLLIVPAVSALVIGGMAVVSLFNVFPALAMAAAKALIEPLIAYLQWVLDVFASLKLATLPTGTFNSYWLLLIYGLMLLFVRERVRPV